MHAKNTVESDRTTVDVSLSRSFSMKASMFEGTFAEGNNWYDTKRSEEHTSELQSHVRISYAVFCLKKKKEKKKKKKKHNKKKI